MVDYFVHESSFVDQGCKIGEGVKIWHFSHIMINCVIGDKCNIGQNVVISPYVVLGRNVKVASNAVSSANMAFSNYAHLIPIEEVIP